MPGYSKQDIADLFGQHKMNDEEFTHFAAIKKKFEVLSDEILDLVPGCPLQTTAINKLFEAKNCATMGYLTDLVKKRRKDA